MGLRPKEYSGYSKNEIITIIYFESKGSDLKAWAKTYDDGFDEDWIESKLDFENPKPTLRFGYAQYDFFVEGYDFITLTDGTITWKF